MITKNEISSLNLSPTKKDFVQIWNELIEVASKITERWDPTSTNESDPGIVLLKVLTGIADKLNYNIDKNILEAYMPTAAQMESMRKLCELVGYDIKYYQSAETTARISYTGNTTDKDSDEYLPDTGLAIPKFTTLTNADKDITFVTTNAAPMLITNVTPWVEVPCIEGQISQCESTNEYNLITLTQLDDNNRYYLPEVQIAENGIFVYNAMTTASGYIDGTPWDQVSNLNTKATELRVFKFGYDSFEGRPYLAFPDDVGSLIGDGLFIYFVRTSGLSGNISSQTLEVLEVPTGKDWENYSAELFEVVNIDATTNGANIESISAAYNNFKKTVGTFDTLVTCRDYMNKIYSLMDASNSPYVSNILVTDIRNDINSAVTLCSCNEFGILYKETPLTEEFSGTSAIKAVEDPEGSDTYKVVVKQVSKEIPLIDHFDLRLYPFKTFVQVSSSTKDKYLVEAYNKSFTYTEQMNREIDASLADFKTCAHNLTTPAAGDIVAINNYLRLNALIATSIKVSEIEAKDILDNVKAALVNEFNLRNLDFGEEIPFDSILSVIENADSRIKVVSLQEPTVLTTYSVKEQVGDIASSKEYGIASTNADKIQGVNYTYTEKNEDNIEVEKAYTTAKGETAKDIYNKLVLRNILAGRASLFDYDETFIPNNSEKPYTVTKNITTELSNKSDNDEAAKKIKEAIAVLINDPNTTVGEYILYDNKDRINQGLYSSKSVLTLKVFDEDITKKLETILADTNHQVYSTDTHNTAKQIVNAKALMGEKELGEYSFEESVKGFSNGILWLVVSEDPEDSKAKVYKVLEKRAYKVYETYEPNFTFQDQTATDSTAQAVSKSVTPKNITSSSIIDNIARVEAVCELNSNTGTFEDITLDKNEVIKFRAPNLITTKTFPAYVYYRFERDGSSSDNGSGGSGGSSGGGSFATAIPLSEFINQDNIGVKKFFETLWRKAGVSFSNETYTFEAELTDPENPKLSTPGNLVNIFNTSIAVEADSPLDVLKEKAVPDANGHYSPDQYEEYSTKFFVDDSKLYSVLSEHFSNSKNKTPVKFRYYPLTHHTSSIWSNCIRELNPKAPTGEILWQLSSTSSHPKGRLVTESGKKLIGLSGDALANGNVGEIAYICTDFGSDPEYSSIAQKTDYELGPNDKLYIHYTPSSTNEDGETVDAEPISMVYKGGGNEPVIIKPSGFTLMPSEDLNKQGTSWKKTDVDFGGVKKNLLALAPNEQIEMRSISRVVLNTPARFYRNFEAKELDGNINKTESYELKDGEYIFYTDQNTQEAAYYGSGSVITLDPGAFIPKATETVEISQILEQGLHLVPWSSYVLLSDSRKVTITEYQYVTLIEGDTLNTLTIEDGNSISSGTWKTCDSALPIKYTVAGAESPTELPKIKLSSTSSRNPSWEVCSFLELSTSPGYTQQLRAAESPAGTTSVTDKLRVYTSTGTGEMPGFEIIPQKTSIPASNGASDIERFEPVSIKLDTIAQVASGNFEKADSNTEDNIDDAKMQIKVFSTDAPTLIELDNYDDELTPISTKHSVPAEPTSENLNNYWTKLDVKSNLLSPSSASSSDMAKVVALNLNFMIPENADLFGIFSIYLEVPEGKLDPASAQNMPKGPSVTESGLDVPGCRVFIDIPSEFSSSEDSEAAIAIFNYADNWWSEGKDATNKNRLYLRAGLNCIRVNKSCNILIKAEANADGSILYDNLRLVKGKKTSGINLELLDPNAVFNAESEKTEKTIEEKVELANNILTNIRGLDKNHDFYYNVPVENSLAIEFDNNINSFSSPYTLYDINNVNNSFVVSKLDVAYLKDGLKIAKSSRY
jgi:hypothetical protein